MPGRRLVEGSGGGGAARPGPRGVAGVTASLDCRSCGACCTTVQRRALGSATTTGWADCTVDDVRRLSRAARTKLVPVRHDHGWTPAIAAIATRRTASGERCAFLRGVVGRSVSCDAYRVRPEVCRSFGRGSEDCLDARRLLGLP